MKKKNYLSLLLISLVVIISSIFLFAHARDKKFSYKEKNITTQKNNENTSKEQEANVLSEQKIALFNKIKTLAQNKGLKEINFDSYKDQIYQQKNSEDLANKKQKILVEIADLANSSSEQEIKDKQKKFQEQAEKEQKSQEEKEKKDKEQAEEQTKQQEKRSEQKSKSEDNKENEWIKDNDIENFYKSIKKEEGIFLINPC